MISQDQVLTICTPHFPALYRLPMTAWDKYHRLLPDEFLEAFHARTRANAVHDLMAREAAKYASMADGVRYFDLNGMRGLVLAELVAIRMKKMNEESMSRGHSTDQVRAFKDQIPLEGFPTVHNLELGYVTNEAETDIAEIRLASPSGERAAWWTRLDDDGAISVVTDFVIPSSPDAEGAVVAPAKIGPKESGIVLPFRKANDNDED